jgi:hypothetical protein
MIQSPINELIVQIASTRCDKIGSIHIDTKFDPTEHATIVGRVHSIPRHIVQDRPDYKGFSTQDIQVGDTVIMRYDVTTEYAKQPENDTPRYKYHFMYRGEHYWRADIQACFAVIRDLEIIMLNGYVMLEPPPPPSKLIIPGHLKKLRKTVGALVQHIGNPRTHLEHIGAVAGDTVYFDPRVMQVYQINGKPFCIIKQTHVCGVEIKDNKKRILDLCDAGGL